MDEFTIADSSTALLSASANWSTRKPFFGSTLTAIADKIGWRQSWLTGLASTLRRLWFGIDYF